MKALVADDDADLRALIAFTLAQGGFEVCSAADGAATLRCFNIEAPGLLVVDINMPELDGLQVCREIRRRSNVPIIVLTVHLTPLELKTMQLLMATAGRTVTADRLLIHVRNRSTARERRILKQLIYRLRRKLELDPATPELLQTTPGAGYKLMIPDAATQR
jgi:DNA-binding response OmpR family regulator